MPVNYSESPVSVSEGNPPPPSRPRHKIPWWVFGLGCLVTAASIFLFSRLGISSSGSFSAIGDAEDSSFITLTAVPTSTPIAIVEKAGCLPQVTGRQTLAQACVSDPAPRQYSSVTLYSFNSRWTGYTGCKNGCQLGLQISWYHLQGIGRCHQRSN